MKDTHYGWLMVVVAAVYIICGLYVELSNAS